MPVCRSAAQEAWDLCNKIDNLLEKLLITLLMKDSGISPAVTTNIGTGIRASVMLHLPALVMTGYIKGILEICSKLGIAVRGLYGENTEASGICSNFQSSVSRADGRRNNLQYQQHNKADYRSEGPSEKNCTSRMHTGLKIKYTVH